MLENIAIVVLGACVSVIAGAVMKIMVQAHDAIAYQKEYMEAEALLEHELKLEEEAEDFYDSKVDLEYVREHLEESDKERFVRLYVRYDPIGKSIGEFFAQLMDPLRFMDPLHGKLLSPEDRVSVMRARMCILEYQLASEFDTRPPGFGKEALHILDDWQHEFKKTPGCNPSRPGNLN